MRTPWGESDDDGQKLADGIIAYTTPSHGGIYVSPDRVNKIPPNVKPFTGNRSWWEEDCDWCVPFIVFQDDIRAYDALHDRFNTLLMSAYETARSCHPALLQLTLC